MHRTKVLNDGYMGSGSALRKAQKKYGMKNFTKEILFIFDNVDDMYTKEAELVTEEFIKLKTNYNLYPGGVGSPRNAKETEYFKSGRHVENTLEARRKALLSIREKAEQRRNAYYLNPKLCRLCNSVLNYDIITTTPNVFCNSSCAASYANGRRAPRSDESKQALSEKRITDKGREMKLRRQQFRENKQQCIDEMHEYLKTVDFSIRGWVTKFSEFSGMEKGIIKRWICKYLPEIYQQAYQR